jgi:LPS export ABC transporter protein LptC
MILLAACAPHPQSGAAAPSPTPAATIPAYLFHGRGAGGQPVKLQNMESGRMIYDLKATDVFYSTSSSKGRFLNDKITFYNGKQVRLTVTAPVGDVDRTTYDFALQGGVTATSSRGVVLVSDTMSYDGTTKLLTAAGHVHAIDSQGDVLAGDKAVSDLDLEHIHMSGDVRIGKQR